MVLNELFLFFCEYVRAIFSGKSIKVKVTHNIIIPFGQNGCVVFFTYLEDHPLRGHPLSGYILI